MAHPFNFEVPEDKKVPVYVNMHSVIHNYREFFIDLATAIPYEPTAKELQGRVVFRFSISKTHLQELILNLQGQLKDFDKPQPPPQTPPPPPLGEDRFKR